MAAYYSGESRAHIRFHFNKAITAELRLVSKEGRLLTDASSAVELLDISRNGLCFMSDLLLPVQHNYLIEMRMTLSKAQIIVRGRIVWNMKAGEQFRHGVAFECSDTLRSFITGVLNQELLARQPQQHKVHYLYNRMLYSGLSLRQLQMKRDSRKGNAF